MIFRGMNFGGPVLSAAGVQGFFGEGYRHHKILRLFGQDFSGITLVTKTTTLRPNQGNMPLAENGITPKEFAPKCILPNLQPKNFTVSLRMFLQGIMLNAVKLSGPGTLALLQKELWQKMEQAFWISFMAIGATVQERLQEYAQFVALLKERLPDFKVPVGVQVNLTCPNVGLDIDELVYEGEAMLEIGAELERPQMPKVNVLTPVRVAKQIASNANCDAICTSNTVRFGLLPGHINWKKLFGTDVSPLAEFGGGGLSGPPLLALVVEQTRKAREAGITKHINAGGGISRHEDVDLLKAAGASSVFLGTSCNLRSWRMRSIVRRAYQLF